MAPSIRLYDEDGSEVYKVAWLATEGAALLNAEEDEQLREMARWLMNYGEPGDAGTGQYLIPELVVFGTDEPEYVEGLEHLCRATNALMRYVLRDEKGTAPFHALLDLLCEAEDACATPVIWG